MSPLAFHVSGCFIFVIPLATHIGVLYFFESARLSRFGVLGFVSPLASHGGVLHFRESLRLLCFGVLDFCEPPRLSRCGA